MLGSQQQDNGLTWSRAAAISAISRCQTNNWILTFISRLDTGHLLHRARAAGPSFLQAAYYQHYYFIYYFYSLDMTGDMIVAMRYCASSSCRIHGFAPVWMYPYRVTVTSESKICADLCCLFWIHCWLLLDQHPHTEIGIARHSAVSNCPTFIQSSVFPPQKMKETKWPSNSLLCSAQE